MARLFKATPTSPELMAGQVSEGPPVIVKGQVVAATTPLASFTWSMKVPLAVGVPVIAPVEVLRVRPAGRVPVDSEKVKGAVPPVTVMAGLLNAMPTSPELTAGQVSEGAAAMVKGQQIGRAHV